MNGKFFGETGPITVRPTKTDEGVRVDEATPENTAPQSDAGPPANAGVTARHRAGPAAGTRDDSPDPD